MTPETLEKARYLRTGGASWGNTMAHTGETIYALRCALDRGFRERRAENERASRFKKHLKLQAAE